MKAFPNKYSNAGRPLPRGGIITTQQRYIFPPLPWGMGGFGTQFSRTCRTIFASFGTGGPELLLNLRTMPGKTTKTNAI